MPATLVPADLARVEAAAELMAAAAAIGDLRGLVTVSYTHLDVYKRQTVFR